MEHSNTDSNFDVLDALSNIALDDSLTLRDKKEIQAQQEIEEIIKTTPSEADQIDAIAAKRGWFRPQPEHYPTYATVKAYTAGSLDLASAAIRHAEQVAANQRQFYSHEKARERWGDPLPEDEIPVEDNSRPSTGNLLEELGYTILHVAKQTPWRDAAGQKKLVDLVRALKARPDPPPPAKMTKALRNNWSWSVWSELSMLSPSARESWNDQPGCGAGFSVPEIHAWANVNAFIARITQAGLAGFWMYAIWALRDALEEEHLDYDLRHKPEKAAKLLDAFIPAAAVWIIVMGRELWEKDEDLTPKSRNEGDPARGGKLWKGKSAFCKERWDLWATRFEALSKMEGLMAETREIAAEAFASMEKIKGTAIINPPLVLLGCPGYESFSAANKAPMAAMLPHIASSGLAVRAAAAEDVDVLVYNGQVKHLVSV
ncbi:hypothetical protein AOQ84DRAFT_230769 [Glonium stellatum]|uniref:Uncharacterized protein n=1 Tax=Glonium stellatum TaxID=574774 RepID=A0A8E2EMS3_9PEZI|nr:hypothetical protein AOQ84DRAFT_230769 [Glonium stellatum]